MTNCWIGNSGTNMEQAFEDQCQLHTSSEPESLQHSLCSATKHNRHKAAQSTVRETCKLYYSNYITSKHSVLKPQGYLSCLQTFQATYTEVTTVQEANHRRFKTACSSISSCTDQPSVGVIPAHSGHPRWIPVLLYHHTSGTAFPEETKVPAQHPDPKIAVISCGSLNWSDKAWQSLTATWISRRYSALYFNGNYQHSRWLVVSLSHFMLKCTSLNLALWNTYADVFRAVIVIRLTSIS